MRKTLFIGMTILLAAAPAAAQLTSELLVAGFTAPVAVVQDPTQPDVQLVVEQGGRIRAVRNGAIEPVDFLDLTPLVLSGGERGLLGLAFAPDYATTRRFYVNYTRQPDGHTVISRYLRSASDPLLADPGTRFDLTWPGGSAFIVQPFANHNAGDLVFGSDGYLYVPLGDGGGGNDPDHRAQNPAELLGKVLRLDVSVSDADAEGYDVPPDNPFVGQPGVLPEIWAFGLRNPFRVSLDAISHGGAGALLISDVGQNAFEEVNYQPSGAGGRNYGWRNREGAHDNVTTLPPAYTPLTDPIVEYSRALGNVITGGVVNRGTGLGIGYWGRYFFADFGAGRIWSVNLTIDPVTKEATASPMLDHTAALGGAAGVGSVSAFGIRADCEVLYLNYSGGELRRIVNASAGAPAGCPTSQDPFLASNGGVFVNGTWFARDHPAAAGAGLAGEMPGGSGCTTPQPVADWVCVGGGWVPPDHPLAGNGSSPPPAPPPPAPDTSTCTTPQPVSGWVCINGGWVPPDHPLAGSGSAPPPPPPSPPPPTPPPGPVTCTTAQPVAGWLCVNGGWVPPDHPLAGSAPPPPPPPPPVTSGGCSTVQPAAGWLCVNGGWVPPDHPLAGGGG